MSGPGRSLFNDYQMHKRILDSLRQLKDSTSTDLAPPRLSYNTDMTPIDCQPLAPTSTNSAPLDSPTSTNSAPPEGPASTNSAPLDSKSQELLPPRIKVLECHRFMEAADHE
ncbi:MAG: hypothetical protein FRX48_02019 [Lasallia pustulata]|uniref:Uncharacterized protein n=1 Tax=Lasallia pustulata TaxID=136370 RepID=A0A5M8PY53_9LECA|nr:MAG: hypothetical protein FRX48_02019 [Lasallia pustulata]